MFVPVVHGPIQPAKRPGRNTEGAGACSLGASRCCRRSQERRGWLHAGSADVPGRLSILPPCGIRHLPASRSHLTGNFGMREGSLMARITLVTPPSPGAWPAAGGLAVGRVPSRGGGDAGFPVPPRQGTRPTPPGRIHWVRTPIPSRDIPVMATKRVQWGSTPGGTEPRGGIAPRRLDQNSLAGSTRLPARATSRTTSSQRSMRASRAILRGSLPRAPSMAAPMRRAAGDHSSPP